MKKTTYKIPIERGEGGQPFIQVFFDVYTRYYAIIDTGCDHSFIDTEVFQCDKSSLRTITVSGSSGIMKVEASDEHVTMLARDTRGRIVDICATMLAIDGWGIFNTLSHKLPEDAEEGDRCCMIIGCDLLRAMNAIIDMDMGILYLLDEYDNHDE